MRAYNADTSNTKTRECIYCGSKDDKPIACNKIQDVNRRRKFISSKKLCFNFIGLGNCGSEIVEIAKTKETS